MAEVLRAITFALRALLKKAPTEALLLDNYGQLCLALDEIIQEVGTLWVMTHLPGFGCFGPDFMQGANAQSWQCRV